MNTLPYMSIETNPVYSMKDSLIKRCPNDFLVFRCICREFIEWEDLKNIYARSIERNGNRVTFTIN